PGPAQAGGAEEEKEDRGPESGLSRSPSPACRYGPLPGCLIMRLSLLPAVLLTFILPAQAGADVALPRVFELTRVQQNCEQVAPLLQQDMSAEQQQTLGAAFAAGPFCEDLLERTSARLEPGQSEAAVKLLESPLVEHFAAAERAVGLDGELAS